MSHQIPETLILGTVSNEWPIQAFTSESHAMTWLREKSGRKLTRVTISDEVELRLVAPEAYLEPVPEEGT